MKTKMTMDTTRPLTILLCGLALWACGCSGTKQAAPAAEQAPSPNREIALQHYLEGSVLDQKEDYARAILEYQEALRYMKDPAIYFAAAKDYAILGKYDRAVEAGKEAVRLEPNRREYHEALADIYINSSQVDGAIAECEAIVALDSSYLEGWMNLARLESLRDQKKALALYERIIDRFGAVPDAYLQMAQIYSVQNRLDKAAEALRGMLAADPGNFDIKKTLGDTYLREDSVDQALQIYGELAELQPTNVEVRAAIAHAYLVKQDYERAAQQFETVMRGDTLSVEDQLRFGQIFTTFIRTDSAVAPYAIHLFEQIRTKHEKDWRPYWFLGAIYEIVNQDSAAYVNYQKVKELASWNADGWVGMASVDYDNNKFSEGIELLLQAKNIVPDEFRIHFLLGISYQRLHQPIDAAAALERSVQLNPKSVEAYSALGLVYDELERHEDSDTAYERALKIDPRNHLVLNNYSYSMSERGIQLERALSMSTEALRQQPANTSYLDTYGWILYRLNRFEEAKTYVQKAIDLGSKSAAIFEHMGDIWLKLSDKDKALDFWKKALELDSTNTGLREKIQRGNL